MVGNASPALPDAVAREVVGRRAELRFLLNAIRTERAVLLLGLPGVSKTTMLRALGRALAEGGRGLVEVTGDEQLSAQSLVGAFDPPLVLKGGYHPEHFVPGPLVTAMRAGGILYVEEVNRAPAGALNALMTALSDRYVDVPHLGRVDAASGFTLVGAANPLDDIGTARLSRGLVDRFVTLELDYQDRYEELEIVLRRCGRRRAGLHPFAVDLARDSRSHADLRHGASIRGAIDFVDLMTGYGPAELDLALLRFVACAAYGPKMRVRPAATRTACQIVWELIDALLRRDYGGSVERLAAAMTTASIGDPADAGEGEEVPVAMDGHGDIGAPPGDAKQRSKPAPDQVPGLSRPGGGSEPGASRSVPMVKRQRPVAPAGEPGDGQPPRARTERALEPILRRARELVLRHRDGAAASHGHPSSTTLASTPWSPDQAGWLLDLDGTMAAMLASGGELDRGDLRVMTRPRHTCNYVIFVDHSGSMVGTKLELAATLAVLLAQLSDAGRADYAVVAFDDELRVLKSLDDRRDVEEVAAEVMALPEGRATDLERVFRAAADLSERLPEGTDVVVISDCMPTRGETTFSGLASLAARVPSMYICYTDERSAAITFSHANRQLDLYQWWARCWVGKQRLCEVGEVDEIDALIEVLSTRSEPNG
ncbi:MAG: AAA family ATPase [Acidimicrobiales bacterium]